MRWKSTKTLLGAVCLGTVSCGQIELREASSPPDVTVTVRSAAGAVSSPAVLPTCAEVQGAVEIGVSAADLDGLSSLAVTFTGSFTSDGVRVSPGGSDIMLTEGGLPGQEDVRVTFAPVAGQGRTSAMLNFTTQAPHTGTLTVVATDRSGAAAQSGPNRLVPPGGCTE